MSTSAVMTMTPRPEEATAPVVVFAFAERLPEELAKWIGKRGMRLELIPPAAYDPARLAAERPAYLLVDLDAFPPTKSPADLVRSFRAEAPAVKVILIGHRTDETFVRSVTEAGASGVVTKQPSVSDLALALETVATGRSFISNAPQDRVSTTLTPRELEVLELMANGGSNQVIAERLSISVKTVEAHRARIFRKLCASNVADAIRLAIRAGLVIP